ncbi:MAG: sulfite exporter TauE/SafE family protein [Pseudomonadota bacterium]
MLTTDLLFIIPGLVFVAALVQGTVGFGFALAALPALTFVMDVKAASAMVALCALLLATVMLVQNRRHIDFNEAAGLIGAAVLGVPFGVLLLARAPEDIVLTLLGVVIASFSVYALVQPKPPQIQDRRWRYACGFVGGVLGGAYNTSGPPIVLYSAMRSWPPAKFVAITQAFFATTYLMVVVSHGVGGLWTRGVIVGFLISIPSLVAATLIGKRIAQAAPVKFLSKAVYVLLLILGGLLILTNAVLR